MFKKTGSKLALLVLLSLLLVGVPVGAEPLRDISGHWAEKTMADMVSMGILTGYPDGLFRPENAITRAEFTTALVKALKLPDRSTGLRFSDTTNHWAKDRIITAANLGLVCGYGREFRPDDIITREQMAAMIVRAVKLEVAERGMFTDSSQVSDWAYGAVAAASGNNLIKGYPDNTFRPQNSATRAEAVTVISRALK